MTPNFYYIFQKRLLEQDEIKPDKGAESTLEKVLTKSKKITKVLSILLTSQETYNKIAEKEIREIVGDIRYIAYKPTTFRVVIKNGNYFDIKYDPSPYDLKYNNKENIENSFVVLVSGKKYNIANKSEKEQALDYINQLLKTNPIVKEPQEIEEPGAETPPPEGETPPEGEAPPEEEKAPKEK